LGLALANFPGAGKEEILERMMELSLYAEESIKKPNLPSDFYP